VGLIDENLMKYDDLFTYKNNVLKTENDMSPHTCNSMSSAMLSYNGTGLQI
jgi:hypothetical protein